MPSSKYEWFEAPNHADQAALFKDGVQVGNWFFSYKLYRKFDATTKSWGRNVTPPVEPPESLQALRLARIDWQVVDYPPPPVARPRPVQHTASPPPALPPTEKATPYDYSFWLLLFALGLGVVLWRRR